MMVAPVGKLPTELLVEIFAHAVHSSHSSLPPHLQAVRLSGVCSLWQRVVNNSPGLWAANRLEVSLNNDSAGYLDGLKMLLDRSSPLPIAVLLTLNDEPRFYSSDYVAYIFKLLAPTMMRWKDLEIDRAALEHMTPGPFPALECLELEYSIASMGLFSRCSRLRRVTATTHKRDARVLQLPWAQLTHLSLRQRNPAMCREILLQCTHLVSATLTMCEWETVIETPSPTLLPFLATLEVAFLTNHRNSGHVGPLFAALALPALHTLYLHFPTHDVGDPAAWPAVEFAAFLRRSPHITSLSLLQVQMLTPSTLIALLRLAPCLTKLSISASPNCLDNDFLQALAWSLETDPALYLMPRLEELRLDYAGNHLHALAFVAAIRSRTDSPAVANLHLAPLRVVMVTNLRIPDPGAIMINDNLQDLVDRGLKLSVS
ncbi:hypothetical protein C8F04DRAFT_453856 [Mycena alexandri]|uniref:F-box domain-containing protein n=1 Tax=Mycena alexandri TaxID=1745969 RepID=A0AAD6XDF8_9AGAR|nr:hypothetical protein C8F04DRAFT_453856 [Mycena alexandri]